MSTYKGQTAADSGSLFKLCTIYGRLWEITESLGKKFVPVTIPAWKGQLDKEKVKIRVDRILPNNDYKSHAIDAVGIGFAGRTIEIIIVGVQAGRARIGIEAPLDVKIIRKEIYPKNSKSA
jgi:hypothetical protein